MSMLSVEPVPSTPARARPRHPPAWELDDLPPAPLEEDVTLDAAAAAAIVDTLPLTTRFRLRAETTPIQAAFLGKHGFLVYDRVASLAEIETILAEVDRVEQELLAKGTRQIFGVPVWFGFDPDGKDYLFRMGFTSTMSDWLAAFVRDRRFEPVRRLIGEDARIGDREKDGVVFNRYVRADGSLRPDLGWHTDALRDVVYNWAMPGPMLNIGLHFDRIRPEDGGLRLLPGTHTQSAWSTLFRKVHFYSNDADSAEIAVETWPGDLTVHDGRMWHRVQGSPATGWKSLRRSMYVPYVIDGYAPKDANSRTPLYMRLFDTIMRYRAGRERARMARR